MSSDEVASRRARLAARLRARTPTVAPGVFDLVSARVADRIGFDVLYLTGYGVSASHLGLPDAGLATYSDMVGRVAACSAATRTPLIADADTGYGGLLNVHHTVRGYEAAGAAGLQLEDQEFPKKCGHTPTRRVVPEAEMVRKLRVALDARSHDDFLVVARTDARTALGLDEAIRRARAYRDAGADLIFVESPESVAEFERIGREIDAPLVANLVEGGRSPRLAAATLGDLGFTLVLNPLTGLAAAVHALTVSYAHLKRHGSSDGLDLPLHELDDLNRLLGFDAVWAFEQEWGGESS